MKLEAWHRRQLARDPEYAKAVNELAVADADDSMPDSDIAPNSTDA